jgi:uncharacterized protein YeeX (DUF496 family)
LEILKEQQIPLVVTDYKMPEDGTVLILLRKLKEKIRYNMFNCYGFVDVIISGKEDFNLRYDTYRWKKDEVRNKIHFRMDAYYRVRV